MKNILVPIDFEEAYSLLVDQASELAEKFGSKVWLLHVAAPDPDFVGYEPGPQYIRDFRAEDLKEEHRTIDRIARLLGQNGIEAEGLLIQGATTEMVTNISKKLKVDLVIIGHHEHSLLYEAFIGSRSINIINKLQIPVLLVPLDKEEGHRKT